MNIYKEFEKTPLELKTIMFNKLLWWLPEKKRKILFTTIFCLSIFYSLAYKISSLIEIPKNKSTPVPSPVQGITTEQIIEEKTVEEILRNRCNGIPLDILSGQYFDIVGGERFRSEDIGYSAKGTAGFQATSQSRWGCKIPFEVQIVSFPVSGKSFGLFFEYENMFKILVGDGDRKTIRVEENKYGHRGTWPELKDANGNKRPTLINPIEDGEEVTLIIKTAVENSKVKLHLKVLHSKFQSAESFNFEFVPNGVNFQSSQQRKFRVGINDSRYKGEGSVVDLKTFSVKEIE